MTDPTPQQILDLPLEPNDSGANTVRGYLVALLAAIWNEKEGFSGKRPFGNSGWDCDFNQAFIKAGWVTGKLDEEGWVDEVDSDAVDRLVTSAIKALGEAS